MPEEEKKKEEKPESDKEEKSKPKQEEQNKNDQNPENEDEENNEDEDSENNSENDDEYDRDEGDEEGVFDQRQLNRDGPHFNFIESYFFVVLAVLGDVCDGIWVTRFIFAPATLMWLYFKGVNAIGKNVIAQLVELIPGVGWLPISTVAAVLTIWQTNNPESFEKTFGKAGKALEKIQKIESKIKGKK